MLRTVPPTTLPVLRVPLIWITTTLFGARGERPAVSQLSEVAPARLVFTVWPVVWFVQVAVVVVMPWIGWTPTRCTTVAVTGTMTLGLLVAFDGTLKLSLRAPVLPLAVMRTLRLHDAPGAMLRLLH